MKAGEKKQKEYVLSYPRTIIRRAAFFAFLWWGVTGAEPGSWWFGVPVVILAAAASTALRTEHGSILRTGPALQYTYFFLRESVLGGIDVARRALSPGMPIKPAFIWYECRLPAGTPRVLFADTMSLLPGTVSAVLDGPRVFIHILDERMPVTDKLRELEERVARLFGIARTPQYPGEER